ncbi:hypothetical protein, unlikely [Trypanosoma congolense IL3000]|uniref:Uncharacterized protein n=1 Tax=Trypanosoma congolense (strain IL3000) TaxID=1068625 RepID=F9W6S1_TRYCI|nr:hypothetical protein, unlikely [Trypanosoma congolense IL3000]
MQKKKHLLLFTLLFSFFFFHLLLLTLFVKFGNNSKVPHSFSSSLKLARKKRHGETRDSRIARGSRRKHYIYKYINLPPLLLHSTDPLPTRLFSSLIVVASYAAPHTQTQGPSCGRSSCGNPTGHSQHDRLCHNVWPDVPFPTS